MASGGADPPHFAGDAHAGVHADLSAAARCWAQLDLESLRPRLDEEGLKIAEYQEEAVANRRKLAESTKEFRRTVDKDNAVAKACGNLLRQYQEEIDRLTKRAKHGEVAFLHLYQKLFEAPDPAPALAAAFETASHATDLEAQCRRLTLELAEYKAESNLLKNQDHTIRKLEDKIRVLELSAENKDREIQAATAKAIAAADAERIAQMEEREQELSAMLAQAQSSLATMQKLHHASQNQLFAIQSQTEEESMGRQSELELASAELERAQQRLAALEMEKNQLQHKLTSARPADSLDRGSGGGSAGVPADAGSRDVEECLRAELAHQRDTGSQLQAELSRVRDELDEAHSMWESRVEGLKATLSATEAHAQALEQELGMRPTAAQVEDLRHQIRLLQAVRYNTSLEAEDDDSGEAKADGGERTGAAPSLDSALLAKNRHLEHELTMARLKTVDISNELDTALSRISDLEEAAAKQQALVDRLEEDLLASRGTSKAQTGSGGPPATPGDEPLSRFESVGDGDGADGGANTSMLRVLCSQRDRFRQRAAELEEELARAKLELSTARNETAAARADNVALVERLRYVHDFRKQHPPGTTARDVEGGGGAEVERRYQRIYEDGLNPFKEFQGQQKERQKQRMGVVDRAMYRMGQLVFGNQGARLFVFFYLLALHMLVLGLLGRMTHHHSHALYSHGKAALDAKANLTTAMHAAVPDASGGITDARLP